MPLSLSLAIAVSAGVVAGVFLDPSVATVVAVDRRGRGDRRTRRRLPKASRPGQVARADRAGRHLHALLPPPRSDRALHPPLRNLLEQRLGGFAIEDAGGSRGEAAIAIEGRLLADATPTETGAVMRMQVERVWLGECPEPARRRRVAQRDGCRWRRAVGGPVAGGSRGQGTGAAAATGAVSQSRRARPGAACWRGAASALVGSVKSAALVEVTATGSWFDETAAAARAAVRSRDGAPRRRARPAIGGGCDGDPDRRSRLARSRTSSGGCRRPARIT